MRAKELPRARVEGATVAMMRVTEATARAWIRVRGLLIVKVTPVQLYETPRSVVVHAQLTQRRSMRRSSVATGGVANPMYPAIA